LACLYVGVTESDIVAVDVNSLEIIYHWKAVHNSVLMLRTQTLHSGQSMLGVADLHSGITVYDLCVTLEGSTPPFSRLYHVDVDEVRHFELVGACVAVFHRHEPNISFWNVLEQRTILCINVQEQTRKLSEEFIVDNEEDADGNVYQDSNYEGGPLDHLDDQLVSFSASVTWPVKIIPENIFSCCKYFKKILATLNMLEDNREQQ